MSRVLFVVSSERSHVNPCIGPALHLQQQGTSVAFYSFYSISDQLKRAGFGTFYSGKAESAPPVTRNRARYFAEHLKDKEWTRFSLRTAYLDRVAAQVEPLSNAVNDFRPDLMVVDPKVYEAAIVAEMKRIPWVTLSPSLTMVSPDFIKTDLVETVNWFANDRDTLFNSFGVKVNFRFSDCLSPHLNLCLTTDELIGNTGKADVKRIGPSLPNADRGDECDFPWKKLDDKVPIIYVWFGGQTFYQPGILRHLFQSVKHREVQLVCACSELTDEMELEYVPKNVLLLRQTPQLSLLPAMAGCITHGGASTVMEALAMGVPLLCCPLYDDQPHQSYFVDKCGVGQRQDLTKLDTDECWRAIQFILQSPRIKQAVEKVQLSYKKYDGAADAARLVERLLVQAAR